MNSKFSRGGPLQPPLPMRGGYPLSYFPQWRQRTLLMTALGSHQVAFPLMIFALPKYQFWLNL